MENAKTFGTQARAYASARPTYPTELFDWIQSQAPKTERAWDVGTGSGQAALTLADRFIEVRATDIDLAQIEQAATRSNIRYSQSPAHNSGLPSNSMDAITAATALHWFDMKLFWKEVIRVGCPNAIFCAWTYHRAKTDQDVQRILLDPILKVLSPYWAEGNRISWRGYSASALKMPFETLLTPHFACSLQWKPTEIIAFVRSWSAHKKARLDGHTNILNSLEYEGLSKLDDKPRSFILPLHIIAAKVVI